MMRAIGIALLVSGILLAGLSGLEKILIYISLNQQTSSMQYLKGVTPKYIWNITNYTFNFGILTLICGVGFLLQKQLKLLNKQLKVSSGEIEKMNDEFDKKYNKTET
jgi:hypothetical protein